MSASAAGLAADVVSLAAKRGLTVATAESCTGGLVSAALTDVPGASSVFTHGFVTYADRAKTGVLGVPAALIAERGAVSAEVAEAMAAGALRMSGGDVAIALTGIAGPGGGSAAKPVGLVWFGLATADGTASQREIFEDKDRVGVRAAAVEAALAMVLKAL